MSSNKDYYRLCFESWDCFRGADNVFSIIALNSVTLFPFIFRHHSQQLRAHFRPHRQGRRQRQVLGQGVLPRNLQRGGQGPAREGPEPQAGGQREARLDSFCLLDHLSF